MALAETGQAELEQLRALAKSALPAKQLIDKLGANPKTRRRILELMKEINPDVSIPELDAAKPYADELASLREEMKADRKALADEKAEAAKRAGEHEIENKIASGRKSLRERGYQDDGIQAIEKLMQDRGLIDYDAAEALFSREMPKDEPITPNGINSRSFEFTDPSEADDLIKKATTLPRGRPQENALRAWTNRELTRGMNEIKQNRSRRVA